MSFFFLFSFFATNGQVQLDGYKIECRSCELLFYFLFFCNQWTSAAWWLQDRMSVVWASFFNFFFNQWKSAAWWLQDRVSVVWASFFKFFFFATNGKVQLYGYKIGCRSCELLFSSFFCNQRKSAAWWLQDWMSVVWAFFLKFFFFATNGKVQLDGYKIECRPCELLFWIFFFNQLKSAA